MEILAGCRDRSMFEKVCRAPQPPLACSLGRTAERPGQYHIPWTVTLGPPVRHVIYSGKGPFTRSPSRGEKGRDQAFLRFH